MTPVLSEGQPGYLQAITTHPRQLLELFSLFKSVHTMERIISKCFRQNATSQASIAPDLVYLLRPAWNRSESFKLSEQQLIEFLLDGNNQGGAWIVMAIDDATSSVSECLIRWIDQIATWHFEGNVKRGLL